MDEKQDLHFTISFALWQARKHLPLRKPFRDQRESYDVATRKIVRHLDQSGFVVKRRPPIKSPSCGD